MDIWTWLGNWFNYGNRKIDTLIQKVDLLLILNKALEKKMHEEFEALAKRLDAATNEIAKDLKDLKDQIEGGLSKPEATAVVDRMTPIIERLEGLGKDPENPVPTP